MDSRRHNHHHTAAVALNHGRGDGRSKQVGHRGTRGDETGHAVGQVHRLHQQRGQIVAHDVDASKLLHGLGTGAKDQAADSLGTLLSAAAEDVAPAHSVLALELHAVYDFLAPGEQHRVVHGSVLEIAQDLGRLCLSIVGD